MSITEEVIEVYNVTIYFPSKHADVVLAHFPKYEINRFKNLHGDAYVVIQDNETLERFIAALSELLLLPITDRRHE